MNYNYGFKLSKDTIVINKVKNDLSEESLNKTDVIDIKELKFSVSYIKDNLELVASFLNVVIIKENITTVQINQFDDVLTLMKLVNYWEHINKIDFKEDSAVPYSLFESLLDNKYIKTIQCYSMPSYLIDRLDLTKGIVVKTREKHNYISMFMKNNLLNSYSDIYFKKSIIICNPIDNVEEIGFDNFIKINNKLKTIRIIKYDGISLDTIIKILENNKRSNILILLDEKNNDLNAIYNKVNVIKKKYHKYINANNIKFKINYSLEYKKNNLFKEVNLKFLSSIIILLIAAISVVFLYKSYEQHNDAQTVSTELDELTGIINNNTTETSDDDNNSSEVNTNSPTYRNYVSTYNTNYSQVFSDLLAINDQTVGWLKINNTNVNHPVVQAPDNAFYLTHDFKKNKNNLGWIFMDYRNGVETLDKNTIIYGHNDYDGIMFSTVYYMFRSSWYSNGDNQIITFNTPYATMKWKIFSLYQIDVTKDYLQTNFASEDDYMNFINMIQSRSQVDFGDVIQPTDKILTLSTCKNDKVRYVVHAVLVESTPTEQ